MLISVILTDPEISSFITDIPRHHIPHFSFTPLFSPPYSTFLLSSLLHFPLLSSSLVSPFLLSSPYSSSLLSSPLFTLFLSSPLTSPYSSPLFSLSSIHDGFPTRK
jgi:hypothetical protein